MSSVDNTAQFPLNRERFKPYVRAAACLFPFDGFSSHLALGRRALALAGQPFWLEETQLLARETSFCVRDVDDLLCAWRFTRSDWQLGRFTSSISEWIGEDQDARIRLARACGVLIPWGSEVVPPEFRRIKD